MPPEIFDIRRDLGGKSWVDSSAEICIRHSDALFMLDLKPLKYFLPAFVVTALEHPVSSAAEALVYFVCAEETFEPAAAALDEVQRKVVLRTVEFVLDNDYGYFAEQTDSFLSQLERYG